MTGVVRVAVVALCLVACSTADDARRTRVGSSDIAYATLGTAGPVVVLESGLGEDMREWRAVARALAPCVRVVMYDRPGIGRSAPRPGTAPVLADDVATQLADLLRGIGMPPPFILVGHSLGGLYVQAFARNRPQDVAAVVLVDASSPLEPPGVFVSTVPPSPGTIAAAENAGIAPSVAALLAGPPFPPVPLVVLAATDHGDTPAREALWRDVQARTAALSPQGRLEVVAGSGHFIQTDRPAAVVAAVLQVAREAGIDVSRCSFAR
ncbi:MAG: alpha/beta fold hydrolase [Burkholderiales bacterium]|nr:alpha/beta fold hydrolase [Burkholderiales bacterium]